MFGPFLYYYVLYRWELSYPLEAVVCLLLFVHRCQLLTRQRASACLSAAQRGQQRPGLVRGGDGDVHQPGAHSGYVCGGPGETRPGSGKASSPSPLIPHKSVRVPERPSCIIKGEIVFGAFNRRCKHNMVVTQNLFNSGWVHTVAYGLCFPLHHPLCHSLQGIWAYSIITASSLSRVNCGFFIYFVTRIKHATQ